MRNADDADDAVDAAQVMQEVLAESRHLVALLARMESLMTDGATPSGRLKGFANRVVVKKDERTTLVKIADVQWVESKGNYVVLHTSCAEHVLRETLGEVSSCVSTPGRSSASIVARSWRSTRSGKCSPGSGVIKS